MKIDSRILLRVVCSGLMLAISSCAVPKIDSPTNNQVVPRSFGGATSPAADTGKESGSLVSWRKFFEDPKLESLIGQALSGNQELLSLSQEVRMSLNEVQIRQGEFLPKFNLRGGAGIDKVSENTRNGVVEENHEIHGRNFPDPLPDFMVSANISWEVDIWKKLRNAKKAAGLRYLATKEGQNYIVTRLVAEVAEKYYELLALDSSMITLDQTIAIQRKSLKIAELEKNAARGTQLAVQRFQAEVKKNQSEKLIISQEIVEVENRINYLLGRFPQTIQRKKSEFLEIQLRAIKLGVPAQLLKNRSDIRQAESELGAAGLEVEVARARFYPQLDIDGGVGFQAFNAKYLLTSPESLAYALAGDLVAPVINRKAIKAEYQNANAKQIQSLYHYQKTILNAFVEVSNQVSKVKKYNQSIKLKKEQLDSLKASVDSASKLFQNARVEYMEVLLAQRDLQEARMVVIDVKRQQLSAMINTYQALGGGGGELTSFK